MVAKELEAGHSVVVLGDLNDFDSIVLDASGNVPISSVLQVLRDPVPSTSGDGKILYILYNTYFID